MDLKDLNLSRSDVEHALAQQKDYILTKKSNDLYQVQVLTEYGQGLLNIYFKKNNKVSFLGQGKNPDFATQFALAMIETIRVFGATA
ncbi:hypothetical protein ACSFBI_05130 [Variovorax sp. RB3P1]|uniref:hypothetical protein n=1 Tax=Variovorax sp. RB3P1 TaxID=3443732 RepID=UPI003F487441